MVIGRAAQEGPRVFDQIADLEAQSVDEKALCRFEIGGSQHGMAQLAWPNRSAAQHTRGALSCPFDSPGSVVGGWRYRRLDQTRARGDGCANAGRGLDSTDPVWLSIKCNTDAVEVVGDSSQVVLVVCSDFEVDQP